MSNPNQNQNQSTQPQRAASPEPSKMVRVRVKTGKLLRAHGNEEDNEDVFAEAGEVVEVTRKFYEKHCASRQFDSYGLPNGGIADRPKLIQDVTLELVDEKAA